MRNIRGLGLVGLLGLIGLMPFIGAALAETFTLHIVQTGDISLMNGTGERGGFARLATVIKGERAKGPTLFIHSGDTISPSLLSGIDKGAHIIDILNHMDVDAMVPGNHEFDFGPEIFQKRISEAKFPIVASNIVMPGGGGPANSTADRVIEVNGVRIGLYGLTTERTPSSSSPGGIVFTDSVETGLDMEEDLRAQGADIVIAVAHTPLDVDLDLVRLGAADIVLSGHDEHLLAFYDGRTVLAESGAQGEHVVITDLNIETTETNGEVSVEWHPDFRVIDTIDVPPDPEIAALIKGYTSKLDAEMSAVIGKTGIALDSRRVSLRLGETAIGNLFTDVMREAVDADVALINSGSIRGDRQYAPGTELTRRDIMAELPFNNRILAIELTGAQLLAALENGFSEYPNPGGRSLQLSGMKVTLDITKPEGERVLSAEINGKPLDPQAKYVVATNDFMARGGNDYSMFPKGRTLVGFSDSQLLTSAVIDYIVARETIAPTIEGRILMKE